MAFRGEHKHSLDVKSRLILPIKFREELGESIILTKGIDTCLFGFTAQAFAALEEKVRDLPMTNESLRHFVRFFFGSSDEREFDSHGRVVIVQNLREYAQITKDVVVLGLPNRIEIWAADKWDKYTNSNHIDSNIAAQMAELGI